jgi:ribosomal protein S16
MTRVAVHRYNHDNEPIEVVGWFDPESAEAIVESDPMTAERWADAMRRGQPAVGVVETLFRTEHGRWVHHGGWRVDRRGRWIEDGAEVEPRLRLPSQYRFFTDAEALDWLARNNASEQIAAHMPDLPEEKGPGRPEIGGLVQIRLGTLLSRIDAYADEHSCTRAEAVRRLVILGLDQT